MAPIRKNLSAKLQEQDAINPRTRIFVMGCGRSGTWLLAGITTTFDDVFLIPEESPFTKFGAITAKETVHVIKRNHDSYGWINVIPLEIGILAIVRHPFDVMTSYIPNKEEEYHITPLRWNLEMQALRWLIESKRPNALIVRYEDLVADPDGQQSAIAKFFGLRVQVPAKEYWRTFHVSEKTKNAMNGVRVPDTRSIGRWKRDPKARSYVAILAQVLRPQLDWVSDKFGYDTTN